MKRKPSKDLFKHSPPKVRELSEEADRAQRLQARKDYNNLYGPGAKPPPGDLGAH